jgi:hypothetical protein
MGPVKKGDLEMNRLTWVAATILLMIATDSYGQLQTRIRGVDNAQEDPVALGQPLSHWLKVIHDRNSQELELAFDAIITLGPAASPAVPDLTQIVAEPFTPIRVGQDGKGEVLAKFRSILTKGGAVDSLRAIGTGAAKSAPSVIEWSLTVRVLPPENGAPDPLYIDLVAMDVLERMRGAGALSEFGIGAAPAVQQLLESGDAEKRKFAVAILNDASLPIVSDLLKSRNCRDRMLGLYVLGDMWPVVASSHLDALTDILACSETERKGVPNTRSRTLD